tara:strand:+ start:9780 stop:10421 length:642 start_codon:yes stop_codon:yes gene_type:complete
MPSASNPTIYFGYGSNLWLHQMSIRCPDAKYLGIARLNNYTWIINDRGYANVVDIPSPPTTAQSDEYDNTVYGLVYSLTPADEVRLDRNEGVPIAYTKEHLDCDFWSAGAPSTPDSRHAKIDTRKAPDCSREMLVYIDRQRVTADEPRREYIYRMNRGIADAVELGVPEEYVERVMRKFIPAETEEDGEEGRTMAEFAKGQAKEFRDESGVFR